MASTSSSIETSAPVPSPAIQDLLITPDTKGRVRVSKEQRRVILAEFESSGVSAARFPTTWEVGPDFGGARRGKQKAKDHLKFEVRDFSKF